MRKDFVTCVPLIVYLLFFARLCFAQQSAFIKATPTNVSSSVAKVDVQPEPYKIVQSLRNAGKLSEAKEKAQKYLKLNPKDVDVMLMLGILYYQEKNYPLAEKYLNQVILMTPRYLDAYLFLIKVKLASNDYPGARNVAKQGLKYFPSHPDLKKYSKIISTSSKKKTSQNFLSKNDVDQKKVVPLACFQNLANVWIDKVDQYSLQHRYYQVARVSKEALKCDPQNKRAIASLKEVNAISPKYAVGVNEIGILSQNDNVSDLNQTWNYSTLYYSRDTKYGQVIGSINYADRLGKNAAQGQVEFLPVFNENFTLDLAAAYANQPNLFPNYFALVEGYFYVPKFVDFSLGARYADLGEPFYRVYTGSLSKDFSKYWLNFRPYHFVPKSGSSSTFYTFTLRRYFATTDCNITLTIGYGRSPDLNNLQLVDFFVIDNRIVAINAEIPICNHRMAIILGADYQRQIFPTGLIRNLSGGTVGLKWRF